MIEYDLKLHEPCNSNCNGKDGVWYLSDGSGWKTLGCVKCKGTGKLELPKLELEGGEQSYKHDS